MLYRSTRDPAVSGERLSFTETLLRGMAPDGGLYMPEHWPQWTGAQLRAAAATPYVDLAADVLAAFAGGALPDGAVRAAAERLGESFDHAAVTPLVQLEPNLWVLELFHGPTAAFKDLAMQMMAVLTDAALAATGERLLLLTATSGDTGAAAVRAFAGAKSVDLMVLHPLDRVSPVQRRQMTRIDAPNVLNLAVRGDFDDCQRLVKALLADEGLRAGGRVSSVNSINWGRLAGQIPYYIAAAAAVGGPGVTPHFVVPTGNFGDAFAGWAARAMGIPLKLTAAVNHNDALARTLATGRYERRAASPSASVSMDVQAPSNFERLVFEATGRDAQRTRAVFETFARDGAVDLAPDLLAALRAEVSAVSIDEARTREGVAHAWKAYGRVVCPHTAVALTAARDLSRDGGPVIALSTAHPAKFPESVAPVLGFEPAPPPSLQRLSDAPERLSIIAPDTSEARAAAAGLQGR